MGEKFVLCCIREIGARRRVRNQEEGTMRRWVWRALLIVAALAALTVSAAAAEMVYPETGVNGIRYDLSTGTVLGPVEENRSSIKKAEIQAEVGGTAITRIDDSAFKNCKQLESVTIPRTVTSLGTLVFSGCDGLKTVELSDKLTEIPDGTFYKCGGLASIAIPEGVTKIGKNAFLASGLNQVTIPAKVQTIDEGAFADCASLSSVVFQDNVSGDELSASVSPTTDIKAGAFSNCALLDKLTLSGSVKSIGVSAFSSCVLLKKVVVYDGTSAIGKEAFSGCPLTDLVIFGKNVTIGERAFSVSELKNIHFVSDSRPDDWEEETLKLVHQFSTKRTVTASTSCTSTGSVLDSFSCDEKGCKYAYNEPKREVPAIAHTLVEKNPRKAPTCTETGQLAQQGCTICSYVEKRVSIPALGHLPQDVDTTLKENRIVTKEATCSEEGVLTIVSKRCSRCDEIWESTPEPIKKTGHSYDPADNKDHILIPATCESVGLKVIDRVCSKCGHVEDPTADCETCKEYWEKDAPTDAETTAYIAHVKAAVDATPPGHGGSDAAADKLEHTYEKKPYTLREASCERSGISVPRNTCSRCGDVEECADCNAIKTALETAADLTDDQKTHLETHGEITVTPAPGHKIEKIEDKEATGYKAPTCTEAGHIIYKEVECSVCHQKITPDPEDPEALGHDWQKVEGDSAIIKKATCKEEGQEAVGKEACTRCDAERGGTIKPIPRKPHTWTNPEPDETKEDVPATCGKEGESHVISTCSVCGTKESRTIKTPATGQHNWGEWTTTEPTETQAGEKKRTCADCKKEDVVVLPATGGSSDPSDPDDPDDPDKPEPTYLVNLVQGAGGSVSANRSSAASGDRVTLTTWAESGYELDMIRVISAAGGVISLTELGGGQYRFTMPASNVEVRVTFQRKDSGSAWSSRWASAPGEGTDGNPRRTTDPMPTQNPTQSVPRAGVSGQLFRDIPASHWAAGEISWANQMGYMNGSAGRFNPDGTITHQQMWMVLARLTGSRPANMTEARRWAVENSFADGSSPDGAVARHQLVTALYRSAHLMGSTNRNTTSLAGYTDSRTVPAVARDAFSWAVANGIVGGTTNGRLDPNGTLTRAQFAVILYRYSQRI